MSITWMLDPLARDLVIKSGTLTITSGSDEIRQRVETTLLHEYQEYFMDVPGGIPWYELLLGSTDLVTLEAILRQAVFSVPGVLKILKMEVRMSGRVCSVYMQLEVQSVESQLVEEIVINQTFGG